MMTTIAVELNWLMRVWRVLSLLRGDRCWKVLLRTTAAAALLGVPVVLLVPGSVLLFAGAPGAYRIAVAPTESVQVTRAAVVGAMREERGYDRRATTNQSRLQTRVLLRLARMAHVAAPSGAVLFIDHEDWFQAYLETLGLREDEAPLPVRLSHEHQYDILVDARIDAVVERVRVGALSPLRPSTCGGAHGAARSTTPTAIRFRDR